jgi:DNA-binding GntR family transcriptional regulator
MTTDTPAYRRLPDRDEVAGSLPSQIANDLVRRIASDESDGDHLPGRIPSIIDLSRDYQVSRGTAQRSLVILAGLGVAANTTGRGYFIEPRNGLRRARRLVEQWDAEGAEA